MRDQTIKDYIHYPHNLNVKEIIQKNEGVKTCVSFRDTCERVGVGALVEPVNAAYSL